MENLELLYTGKTKNVYALPNGNCLLKFKDECTKERASSSLRTSSSRLVHTFVEGHCADKQVVTPGQVAESAC